MSVLFFITRFLFSARWRQHMAGAMFVIQATQGIYALVFFTTKKVRNGVAACQL